MGFFAYIERKFDEERDVRVQRENLEKRDGVGVKGEIKLRSEDSEEQRRKREKKRGDFDSFF